MKIPNYIKKKRKRETQTGTSQKRPSNWPINI